MVGSKFVSGSKAKASEVNDATGMISVEAGENISAGNVVYIHLTDGKAYVSGTGAADDIRASGVAFNTATTGNDVDIITYGVYTTTGLTDKEEYYLGTAGAISTTLSGVRIGTALSTTQLLVRIYQDEEANIGTVKPYTKSFTGIPSNNMTAFWVECNGQTLSDAESPLNGQVIPNLNGNAGGAALSDGQKYQRFLRGAATSGTAGGADSIGLGHDTSGSAQYCDTIADAGPGAHSFDPKPPYYQVVWIMKVK